jgi:MFS family permease
VTTAATPGTGETRSPKASRYDAGFWTIAAVFALLMSFTTLPTPMYGLLEARDHFGTAMVTVVFAAYGIGVMVGLYFAGHLSDYLGRRRLVLAAAALQIVSAVIFLTLYGVAWLLVARFVCGFGIGMLTAAATAYLGELRSVAKPNEGKAFASTVATVVNTGGLALGPLFAGLMMQFLPSPLTIPFVVLLVAMVIGTGLVFTVPETVHVPRDRWPNYRPQRVYVDEDAKPIFRAAAIAAAAAFSVLGFFTSLTGHLVTGTMGYRSPLLVGAIVFGAMGMSALVQVVLAKVTPRRRLVIGQALFAVGLVLVAVGGVIPSLAAFIVGGLFSGGGVGLVFQASIATAVGLASPEHRGGTLAGMFLAAYVGITVPVILVGIAISIFPEQVTVVVFAAIVLITVLLATRPMLRQTYGSSSKSSSPSSSSTG